MHQPTTYEIVLRGRVTERLLRPLVDDFTVDHPEAGRSRLIGVIRDPAHLHGVMAHLTAVGIEVISLGPGGPGAPEPIGTAPIETVPTETVPTETDSKPIDSKPIDSKPTERNRP